MNRRASNVTSRSAKRRGPARKRAARPTPVRTGTARPKREPKREPEDDELEPAPAPVLSTREVRELRARAHSLLPIVQVGHGGVSGSVISAVNRALHDHELIKVRLHEPEDKRGMAEELATGVRAALCGLIGHTVILYRPHRRKQKRA